MSTSLTAVAQRVLAIVAVGAVTGVAAPALAKNAAPAPGTTIQAISGTGHCPRWGCGSNHNQVRL